LREQGAPVVVTNPGGVYGLYDPHHGESATMVRGRLIGREPMSIPGSLPVVDVRDLGLAHARLVAFGAEQGRFLMAGRSTAFVERDAILRRVTGRRLPGLPIPRVLLARAGPVGDAAQRRGIDLGFSSMSTYLALHGPDVDDRDTQETLGVRWRSLDETFADMVAWLHATGRISAKQAGAVAGQVAPVI
jgi:dihydroflavonol-4-reductase